MIERCRRFRHRTEMRILFFVCFFLWDISETVFAGARIRQERIVSERELAEKVDYEQKSAETWYGFPTDLQKDGIHYQLAEVQCVPIEEEQVWITRVSESVPEPQCLSEPSKYYVEDVSGRVYILQETKILDTFIDRGSAWIEREQHFGALENRNEVPDEIMVIPEEMTEEQEMVFPLVSVMETESYWKEDLRFYVLFQNYDASFYMLGGNLISHNDERPELDGMEELLLRNEGLDPETHRITDMRWRGGTWLDEQYGICRDAVITGERLVRDYLAVYGKEVDLGEIPGKQMEMRYAYQPMRNLDSKVRLVAKYEEMADADMELETKEPEIKEPEMKGLEEVSVIERIESREIEVMGIFFFFIMFLGWLYYVKSSGQKNKKDR